MWVRPLLDDENELERAIGPAPTKAALAEMFASRSSHARSLRPKEPTHAADVDPSTWKVPAGYDGEVFRHD